MLPSASRATSESPKLRLVPRDSTVLPGSFVAQTPLGVTVHCNTGDVSSARLVVLAIQSWVLAPLPKMAGPVKTLPGARLSALRTDSKALLETVGSHLKTSPPVARSDT